MAPTVRPLVAFTLCVALAGCTGGDGDGGGERDGGSGADATPHTAARRPQVVVATQADPITLNPLIAQTNTSSQVCALLFDSLLETRPDLSHGPALAESWEFSEDRKTLTFTLRDDVRWHDGHPFDAGDVVFTYEMQTHDDVPFPSKSWKSHIEDCRALDERTVAFRFTEVYNDQLIDANVGLIVPQHVLGDVPPAKIKDHTFQESPIGTGAYELDHWERGQYVRLVANEDAWSGEPSMKLIVFKTVREVDNRLLQLENGDVDVVLRVPLQRAEKLRARPEIEAHVLPSRIYYYLGWNGRRSLFAPRAHRRALTLAIDRQKIAEAIFGDHAEVCHGPIHPLLWGYDEDVPRLEHDPEKARDLLAAEGWEPGPDGILARDGERFAFGLLANEGNPVKADVLTYVQSMLGDVGIEVNQELVEPAAFRNRFLGGEFDAVAGAWGVALKMDLTNLWHSSSEKNMVGYSDEELDRLIDQAVREVDREKSKELWSHAQRIIVEDQPYTFLFRPHQINLVRSHLRNVRMETIAWYHNIEDWTTEEALAK